MTPSSASHGDRDQAHGHDRDVAAAEQAEDGQDRAQDDEHGDGNVRALHLQLLRSPHSRVDGWRERTAHAARSGGLRRTVRPGTIGILTAQFARPRAGVRSPDPCREDLRVSESYPYNGRLSRWEEIADGLAIVGVQALEDPFPFDPGQYATLGLMGPEGKLVQRPMSISSPSDRPVRVRVLHPPGGRWRLHAAALGAARWATRSTSRAPKGKFLLQDDGQHLPLRGHRDRSGAVHEHARHAA